MSVTIGESQETHLMHPIPQLQLFIDDSLPSHSEVLLEAISEVNFIMTFGYPKSVKKQNNEQLYVCYLAE